MAFVDQKQINRLIEVGKAINNRALCSYSDLIYLPLIELGGVHPGRNAEVIELAIGLLGKYWLAGNLQYSPTSLMNVPRDDCHHDCFACACCGINQYPAGDTFLRVFTDAVNHRLLCLRLIKSWLLHVISLTGNR